MLIANRISTLLDLEPSAHGVWMLEGYTLTC